MKQSRLLGLSFLLIVASCNQKPSTEVAGSASDTTSKSVEQVMIPTMASEVKGPASGNNMSKAYVQMVGRFAFVWGYPLVNAHNRRIAFSKAPEPCLIDGVAPFAPIGYNAMLTNYISPDETFITCPNQDVVYGAGFTALDKEPTVFQVPDFGNRFYVYALYDQRTDEIGKIGKQYGTKPGFYMMVGKNWKGEIPKGINAVIRSSTDLVFCVPRIFKESTPEDSVAIQPLLSQVMFYPLSKFDGKMKSTDWSKLPHIATPQSKGPKRESPWVQPALFYDELPIIMKEVDPLPGEESMYAWIKSVWEAASKDSALKKALTESFVAANNEIVDSLFYFKYNGRNIGNGWTAPVNASQWGTDYLNRTAISKSSMYQNTPEETQYQFKEMDSNGQTFNGTSMYTITFPKGKLPPVKGFWSLTLYNAEHLFFANPLRRYSLGTKNKSLQTDADGSLTIYIGSKSPGADKESNWLPAPAGVFSLLLRNYWPEQSIIDGSSIPPDIIKSK